MVSRMATKKTKSFKAIATLVVHPAAGIADAMAAERVISWLMEVAVQIEMEHRQLSKRFTARLLEPVKAAKKGGGR